MPPNTTGTIPIPSLTALTDFCRTLAPLLRPGHTILLDGPIGAGKTTFVSAIVPILGSSDLVHSPTFTLIHHYRLPTFTIYHIDLYRLTQAAEIDGLDIERYINHPSGVSFVEWASKLGPASPDTYLRIQFEFDPHTVSARILRLSGNGREYTSLISTLTAAS